MPIRPENRWLYPIDWRQLSESVRFDRAGARCEGCSRPHLRRVVHLGDGRWWDADRRCWRSDRGKRIAMKAGFVLASVRVTYVVLACAHLDHDPGNSAPTNLKALCQRCHMIHDAYASGLTRVAGNGMSGDVRWCWGLLLESRRRSGDGSDGDHHPDGTPTYLQRR